jgi:type 1 glutamine amidotransferase
MELGSPGGSGEWVTILGVNDASGIDWTEATWFFLEGPVRTLLNATAFFLVAIATSVTGNAQAAETKAKVLIVTGFDVPVHNWEESSRTIHAILSESGQFDLTISTDKEVFASPSLGQYQAIVLSYGFWKEPEPSEQAKSGLLDYVEQGGGVVALHFASSSFQDWDDYGVLLGRVWKKGVAGHGPYGQFEVNIKDSQHPITRGLEDFKTQDELYAKLSGEEKIEVLATAYSDWSESVEPIVFVKRYGRGRVVQNVLGHDLDSKQNASYQQLLINGVQWAATGEVAGQ